MGQISSNEAEVILAPSSAVMTFTMVQNPNFDGVYQYVASDMAGVVAANNFLCLFNPVGSGRQVIVIGGAVASYLVIGATNVRESMRIFRVTSSAGGVLVPVADINKNITAYPDTVAEVRVGNPAVTFGAEITSVPPPVGPTGPFRAVLQVTDVAAPLVLAPGEGVVAHTDAGDADQTWTVQVQWAEIIP